MPQAERSNSTCQVSFSDPGLLSRLHDNTVATAGLSREQPGFSCWASAGLAAGAGAAGVAAGGALLSSSKSFLTMRAVSLPPGTHRFSRSSLHETIAPK